MKRITTLVTIVILVVLAFMAWQWRNSPFFGRLFGGSGEGQLIAEVNYQCNTGRTIHAKLYQGQSKPAVGNQPPVPGGSAHVVLSDGRTLDLKQTLSADGARYSNGDPRLQQGERGAETFVFWSKGNTALVLEDNEQKSYIGCIKLADDPGNLPGTFESGSNGFSIRLPNNWTTDSSYTYEGMGPGKAISGVKFTIDPAIATGTNLASDTYVSVEAIPAAAQCTAGLFLDGKPTVTQLSDGNTTYSYASSTGAAAGNRYEEQVFALPGTNPCVAIRYFVHYGAIENYPEGAVKEFDKNALLSQFDAIRKTLVVGQ